MWTPGTTDPSSVSTTPFTPMSNNGSPTPRAMGLSISKPMGLSISKPMGLSISKPSGLSLGLKKPTYNNDFDPKTNGLNQGNILENISQQGHRSSLFRIKRKNGSLKGVRKIATNNNIYEETTQEAKVYQRLKNLPEAKNYLVGFLGAGSNSTQAYLNLEFVEGEDIISILNSLNKEQVEEFKSIIKGVVEALLWLLNQNHTHGDISNSNFRRGTDGRIRILDLGRAGMVNRTSANKDMNAFYNMFTDKDIVGDIIDIFPFLQTFPKPDFVYAGEDAKAKLEGYYKTVLEWLTTVEGGKRRKTRKNKKLKRKAKESKTTRRH